METDSNSNTYVVPIKPSHPFRKGDIVLVMSRNGTPYDGTHTVLRAGPRVVATDCGRRWNQSGYWLGDDGAYAWPWIMLKSQYDRIQKKKKLANRC